MSHRGNEQDKRTACPLMPGEFAAGLRQFAPAKRQSFLNPKISINLLDDLGNYC